MNYFDIGANLAEASLYKDLAAILQRAQQANVTRISVTGSDLDSCKIASELSKSYPQLTSTLGIHPHCSDQWNNRVAYQFDEQLNENPNIICLGEMGLDYYRNLQPPQVQTAAFIAQCEWASTKKLPMFLHMRDAHQDFYPILTRYRHCFPAVVVHCFTGGLRELKALLDLDCYIGITAWYCDPIRGLPLNQIIQEIPSNRLLIETDAPYLLAKTMPNRPKNRRNEPAFLPFLAAAIAQDTNIDLAALTQQIWQNSIDFFGR